MGFLKRILRTGHTERADDLVSGSFETLSDAELTAHMGIRTYGAFELTDAVRPSYDLQIVPRQGFRRDKYVDEATGATTPVIMGTASRRKLIDTFLAMIEPLGKVVDVVLESSHTSAGTHRDLYREHIDMPVLKSTLLDFEDLLLHDGCTGIAVINPAKCQEVQLDEHKMLIAYGNPLTAYEKALIAHDVYPMPDIRFITEAEHIHSSSRRMFDEFERLTQRLGMDAGKYKDDDDEDDDFAGSW